MLKREAAWVLVFALAAVLPACSKGSPEGNGTNQNTAGASGKAGNASVAAGDSSGGAANVSGTGNGGGAGGGGGSPSGGVAGMASNGGETGAAGGPWMFPAGVTKPRIMIVGDSISAGPGCYKKYLLKNLTDNKYSNFEFVGEYSDDCGSDVKHSAVSCSTSEQYTQATFMMPNCAQDKTFPGMSTLMPKHKPDLVMMQLGVNDVWGGKPTQATLGNYAKLIEQARAQNPNVVLVVAQIQKIRPNCDANDDSITKRAEELVNAVPDWAKTQTSAQSPVFVADLWTNSDWAMAETNDCVHPNDAGAMRMGLNWYNALKGILKPD